MKGYDEAFERIMQAFSIGHSINYDDEMIVKWALSDFTKFKRSLSILMNKQVDVSFLLYSISANHYNSCVATCLHYKQLTDEEWEFLQDNFNNIMYEESEVNNNEEKI